MSKFNEILNIPKSNRHCFGTILRDICKADAEGIPYDASGGTSAEGKTND